MIFNMKEEIEADRSGQDNDKAAVKEILLAAGAVISGESSGERVGKPEKHKPRPVKVRIGIVSDNLDKSKRSRQVQQSLYLAVRKSELTGARL